MMISVSGLTKKFAHLTAVDQLSFTVQPGEVVALWGANGAGKTTALHCLLGLMPFEGEISIRGMNIREQGKQTRALVGFVPQTLNFHDDLTVAETITFYARLKKVPEGTDISSLLAQLDLIEHLQKPVKNLSGGLKQRLALALALLNDPPILILDEPTANLDIRAREDFLLLLHKLKEQGKTMVFSSHRLEEITAVADRVLLLESGRLIVDAPPNQLERQLGWEATLHLYMASEMVDPALELLTNSGLPVSRNGRGVRVQVKPGQKGKAIKILHDAGVVVDDFTVE